MSNLEFNSDDFKKSILETIQPEIQAVQEAIKTRSNIASKQAEFNKKINALNSEIGLLDHPINEKPDFETLKSNGKKRANIKDEINIIKKDIIALGVEAEKCKQAFDPTRTALMTALKKAAQAYIDKARTSIVEDIETLLNNNDEYKKSVLEIFEEVAQENELLPLGFSGAHVPLNLYPISSHIALLQSFIAEYKNTVN